MLAHLKSYREKLSHLPNIEEKCSQSKEEGEGSYGAWSGWHHDGMVWGCFHDGLWLMIMDLKSSEQLKWLRYRKILDSLWIIVNQTIMILILILYQGSFIDIDLDIDSYPGACQDYIRAKLKCCFPLQEDVDAESQPVVNDHNSAPKKTENWKFAFVGPCMSARPVK